MKSVLLFGKNISNWIGRETVYPNGTTRDGGRIVLGPITSLLAGRTAVSSKRLAFITGNSGLGSYIGSSALGGAGIHGNWLQPLKHGR